MLISEAYAQTADAGAAGGAGMLMQFAPLILIFVVFYFLLIRPQQKRAKEHRDMLGNLRRGDRVVTGGGIVGTVQKVADDELTIEIAENVRVKVIRSTVTTVLARTEPAKNGGSKATDADDDTSTPAAANAPVEAEKPKGFGRFLSRK
ncbi:preprotein translocase subunit YajC [Inquilinus sp. YAF38]|uniref:preprotein translocase subunit YajC n=1 Tax=Inquilinus sp. YAF38 TaxID=3233084 RepID=UPI003F90A80D